MSDAAWLRQALADFAVPSPDINETNDLRGNTLYTITIAGLADTLLAYQNVEMIFSPFNISSASTFGRPVRLAFDLNAFISKDVVFHSKIKNPDFCLLVEIVHVASGLSVGWSVVPFVSTQISRGYEFAIFRGGREVLSLLPRFIIEDLVGLKKATPSICCPAPQEGSFNIRLTARSMTNDGRDAAFMTVVPAEFLVPVNSGSPVAGITEPFQLPTVVEVEIRDPSLSNALNGAIQLIGRQPVERIFLHIYIHSGAKITSFARIPLNSKNHRAENHSRPARLLVPLSPCTRVIVELVALVNTSSVDVEDICLGWGLLGLQSVKVGDPVNVLLRHGHGVTLSGTPLWVPPPSFQGLTVWFEMRSGTIFQDYIMKAAEVVVKDHAEDINDSFGTTPIPRDVDLPISADRWIQADVSNIGETEKVSKTIDTAESGESEPVIQNRPKIAARISASEDTLNRRKKTIFTDDITETRNPDIDEILANTASAGQLDRTFITPAPAALQSHRLESKATFIDCALTACDPLGNMIESMISLKRAAPSLEHEDSPKCKRNHADVSQSVTKELDNNFSSSRILKEDTQSHRAGPQEEVLQGGPSKRSVDITEIAEIFQGPLGSTFRPTNEVPVNNLACRPAMEKIADHLIIEPTAPLNELRIFKNTPEVAQSQNAETIGVLSRLSGLSIPTSESFKLQSSPCSPKTVSISKLHSKKLVQELETSPVLVEKSVGTKARFLIEFAGANFAKNCGDREIQISFHFSDGQAVVRKMNIHSDGSVKIVATQNWQKSLENGFQEPLRVLVVIRDNLSLGIIGLGSLKLETKDIPCDKAVMEIVHESNLELPAISRLYFKVTPDLGPPRNIQQVASRYTPVGLADKLKDISTVIQVSNETVIRMNAGISVYLPIEISNSGGCGSHTFELALKCMIHESYSNIAAASSTEESMSFCRIASDAEWRLLSSLSSSPYTTPMNNTDAVSNRFSLLSGEKLVVPFRVHFDEETFSTVRLTVETRCKGRVVRENIFKLPGPIVFPLPDVIGPHLIAEEGHNLEASIDGLSGISGGDSVAGLVAVVGAPGGVLQVDAHSAKVHFTVEGKLAERCVLVAGYSDLLRREMIWNARIFLSKISNITLWGVAGSSVFETIRVPQSLLGDLKAAVTWHIEGDSNVFSLESSETGDSVVVSAWPSNVGFSEAIVRLCDEMGTVKWIWKLQIRADAPTIKEILSLKPEISKVTSMWEKKHIIVRNSSGLRSTFYFSVSDSSICKLTTKSAEAEALGPILIDFEVLFKSERTDFFLFTRSTSGVNECRLIKLK